MTVLRLNHAEELEEIRHQHELPAEKMAQDKSQVTPKSKSPVAFDGIEAPKHRSHVELIRASRRKSVVPGVKIKSHHADNHPFGARRFITEESVSIHGTKQSTMPAPCLFLILS